MNEAGERWKPKPIECLNPKQVWHLFGCLNFTFIVFGIFLILVGIILFAGSMFCGGQHFLCLSPGQRFGNVGVVLILLGSTLYFSGKHKRRRDLKTAAYSEEIKDLIADVERDYNRMQSELDGEVARYIEGQLKHLRALDEDKEREVSHLDLIHLRKKQVDLYDDSEIVAKSGYDLLEFGNITGRDEHYYKTFKSDIDKAKGANSVLEIRAILKNLREAYHWEMFLSGKGEAILESMTHWAMYAIPSLILLGIMPLLYPPYFNNPPLSILNWMFLGIVGAVLYTITQMRNRDTTRVGEDDGNWELRRMLLGIMIGITSAVLLYSALRGQILEGRIFPDLIPSYSSGVTSGKANSTVLNNALSIFWAIFSGFSVKLLGRLMGTAERTISPTIGETDQSV